MSRGGVVGGGGTAGASSSSFGTSRHHSAKILLRGKRGTGVDPPRPPIARRGQSAHFERMKRFCRKRPA